MELTQLEYFKAVAAHNSISRAAEQMHVTQPALSRSIARLEQEVGAPLFDRVNRRVVLNNYGRLFLAGVELAFYQLDSAVESVRRQYKKDRGVLTIACCTEDFLADRLKTFSADNPDVSIRQLRYSMDELEQQLLAREIDIAVTTGPLKSSRVSYEILSRHDYVLVHNTGRGLPKGARISVTALDGERFICDSSRMSAERLTELCELNGFTPQIGYEVEHSQLLYELLHADAGVCIIPQPYYDALCKRYGRQALGMKSIAEEMPKAEMGMAWLKDRPLSGSAERFAVYLRGFMRDEERAYGRRNSPGNL